MYEDPDGASRMKGFMCLAKVARIAAPPSAAAREWLTQKHEGHKEKRCRIGDSREKEPRFF
jgi:hypothetical protein